MKRTANNRVEYIPNPAVRGSPKSIERLKQLLQEADAGRPQLTLEYPGRDSLQRIVAAWSRAQRKRLKLTQAEAARRAGITQPLLARIENPAAAKQATLDSLDRLASAYNSRIVLSFEPQPD